MLGCKLHVPQQTLIQNIMASKVKDLQSVKVKTAREQLDSRVARINSVYSHTARLPEWKDIEISKMANANLPIHHFSVALVLTNSTSP